MKTKSNCPPLLCTLIATTAALPLAAFFAPAAVAADQRNTDFAQVLSVGNTDAVFVVDDFFKYARFDEKSSMAKLLANPAVKSWASNFSPAQITDFMNDLDLSPKETARLFSGKGAIALMLKHPSGETNQTPGVIRDKLLDKTSFRQRLGC